MVENPDFPTIQVAWQMSRTTNLNSQRLPSHWLSHVSLWSSETVHRCEVVFHKRNIIKKRL
eukprot:3564704-Amphidinium_carterae.1